MQKIIFNLLIVLLFSCNQNNTSNTTDEQTISSSDSTFYFTIEGKSYAVYFVNMDWENAATYAAEQDGYLTEINSQAEQDSIFQVLTQFSDKYDNTTAPDGGGFPHFWIGANDLSREGVWNWDGDNNNENTVQFWQGTQAGTIVNGLYNNWGYEPSNGAGGQDAGGIVPVDWTNGEAGTWNDVKETNELYFIVEFND